MYSTTLFRLRRLLNAAAAAAFVAACSDNSSVAPDRQREMTPAMNAAVAPDLGTCDSLSAPEGSTLAFHTFASGVQIYRWSGTAWTFVAPEATLSADAAGNGRVGIHYAGPTWESTSGSKVVGAVAKRCPSTANAIPWLLLRAVSSEGPGIFDSVSYIQRVNTTGGNAPAAPGTFIGDEARVPYTAEYYFYR